MRTYCTAAAAQILLKRLGRDLDGFLAVAEHADLGQVMEHLHAAARVEAAAVMIDEKLQCRTRCGQERPYAPANAGTRAVFDAMSSHGRQEIGRRSS